MNYHATLICRERMRRDWSQEGLCKGICSVSYLSKIEKGRAEPSEEIVRLLLKRLGLQTDPALEKEAAHLAEQAYEWLFSGCRREIARLVESRASEKYRATAAGLDFLLIEAMRDGDGDCAQDAALESCMNARQLALQRLLQRRDNEAIAILPNAYVHYIAGVRSYYSGDFPAAMQYFQTGYDMAARDGAPYLMMDCKVYTGNCYNIRHDFVHMREHYTVARRLAQALHQQDLIDTMDYNTASMQLEIGRYDEAYDYLSRLENPFKMALHKLAICCEKLGRLEEALAALDRADALNDAPIPQDKAQQMCDLVRYRLLHPDYLQQEAYGALLMNCFAMCRRDLPAGYPHFHLPWVIEWCRATRQYKKALDILIDFPETGALV